MSPPLFLSVCHKSGLMLFKWDKCFQHIFFISKRKHMLNTVNALFQHQEDCCISVTYWVVSWTNNEIYLAVKAMPCTHTGCIVSPQWAAAPPGGERLYVQSELGSRWFLWPMCFGFTRIVSALVYVGAQRCQAHVEPHSHSSNTHTFKKLSLIPVYCLWTMMVQQHTW